MPHQGRRGRRGTRASALRRGGGAALAVLATLAACSEWPRDPEGTLERARGGLLRAGAAEAPPFVVRGPDGRPAGPEPELVEAFARSIGARVDWRWGGSDELLRALQERELDVAAVGLTSKTPWSTHVGITRPWSKQHGEERVLAVAAGENATLVALDRVIEARRRPGR